jgi:hypothetical protein
MEPTKATVATSTLIASGISFEAGIIFVIGVLIGSGFTHIYHIKWTKN